MIRIGIIGRIGSGKSYVSKRLGFPVFDADLEVNKIYKKNKKCFIKLKKIFPNYISSFPIKKTEIAKAILKKKNNIKKINEIVHPEVRSKMKKFLIKNKNEKVITLDIPLLIENDLNKKNDILIFVEAEKKKIYKRLKKRPNFNIKILKRLEKLQLPLSKKKKKAKYIIKNNFKSIKIKKDVRILKSKILKYERSNSRY